MSQYVPPALEEQIVATIAGLGCQYAGSEWFSSAVPIWRIYVDGQEGLPVTMAEITQITKQLSALLDVEMPRAAAYRLEVSSPGLDRRLFTLADYVRFQGHSVKMRLHQPISDRRNWVGEIVHVEPEGITLKVDGITYTFALTNIEKTNLIPKLK